MSVSGKLTSQVRRLAAVAEGASNLISFSQVADGFMGVLMDELTRMSELAIRATNGAFSASDRANYSVEFENLTSAITAQVTNARFNGAPVFQTGTTGSTTTVAVSADGANVYRTILQNMRDEGANAGTTGALAQLSFANIGTTTSASAAIGIIGSAIERVATARAQVNSDISVLNFYIQNINIEKINTETANSRIKDLDFAQESIMLATQNILLQASTAMLAQANTKSQSTLALLR